MSTFDPWWYYEMGRQSGKNSGKSANNKPGFFTWLFIIVMSIFSLFAFAIVGYTIWTFFLRPFLG